MLFGLGFTLLFSFSTALANWIGPSSTITIANKDISPDGFKRPASLINGIHPAPIITARKGERFRMNVVNRLTDKMQLRGTSIHWHGLVQRGTSFMDGSAGVTQCPIAPDHSFLYQFTPQQAGTFWYHSHFDVQYCDGIRGVVVIYDPQDPLRPLYDVDDTSTVIALSEWYHTLSPAIVGIPLADSTLINGKGRFPGGPNAELAVINVERGKRYRFRLASISCDPNFMFSIDGHPLMIIEADGVTVLPHTVDSIQILAGQRYSAVVNANQDVGNYWIRALPNSGKGNLSTTFDNGVNSAILRYRGAPNRDPVTVQANQTSLLLEPDLHPLRNPSAPGFAAPGGADITFNLSLAFDMATFRFSINNQSFVPPTVPVLLQIMSGARNAHDLLPKGGVLTLPRNKVVQINIPGGLIGGPHPFHLHGHTFSVVKSANNGKFNFLDPAQRDVVKVSETEGDITAIRFRTDNPGPWVLHCHIDLHFHVGLAIVFAEAPEDITSKNAAPDDWKRLCPIWDALPDSVKHAQTSNAPPPNNSTTKPH